MPNYVKESLGKPLPLSEREQSVGAVKASGAKKVRSDTKKGGFRMAKQSSVYKGRREPSTRKSGNTFKAKPGAS